MLLIISGICFYIPLNGETLVIIKDIFEREYYSKVIPVPDKGAGVAITPVEKLAAGIYTIIATNGNTIYNKKLIIK